MAINAGANVSKLVAFAATGPVPGLNLLKLVAYVVLVPTGATGTAALIGKAATLSATGTVTVPAVATGTAALAAEAATITSSGTAGHAPVVDIGPQPKVETQGSRMPTTVSDLIHSAMRLIGAIAAGETMEQTELDDALVSLNQMLSSWNTEGASLVARQAITMNISTSNFYDLPQRPIKIDAASTTISGVDSALEIMDAAGWEAIPVPEKSMTSIFIRRLYCDYAFPTAHIHLWPSPRIAGSIELWVYAAMPPFGSVVDVINLPEGYEAGLRWNLAVNLAPEYGRPLDPVVAAQAQSFKASLVQLNAGNHMRSQAAAPVAAA